MLAPWVLGAMLTGEPGVRIRGLTRSLALKVAEMAEFIVQTWPEGLGI